MKPAVIVLLTLCALPSTGGAQGLAHFVPSLAFAVLSDSNVLSTPGTAQSDIVRRTTPSLRAGYRTQLWQLAGGYTFDADQFQTQRALSSPLVRQLGDLDVRYVGRVTTLAGTSSYLRTNTPAEINMESGLFIGRMPAVRSAASSTLTRQLSPLTRVSAALAHERLRLLQPEVFAVQARSTTTRSVRAGIERRLSGTDVAAVRYQQRWYAFGDVSGAAGFSSGSQIATVAWTRDLSSLSQVSFLAGPRVSNGRVRPEFAIDLRRRLKSGALTLGVSRTELGALGALGPVDVSRLAGAVTFRPLRRLEVQVAPSLRRDVGQTSALRATISVIDVTATGLINRFLSVQGSFMDARQHGSSSEAERLTFSRDVFTIRVIVGVPGPAATLAPVEPSP